MGPNTAEKAIADLWFYSNPVFVTTKAKTKSAQISPSQEGLQTDISIYPNPANGKLYFKNTTENCEIAVYNLSGQIMFSRQLKGNELNVSDLSKGIYIAKVKDTDKTGPLKFVIE